ncbi:unnamed protein product [Echinostoma caproni]|uniref:SH3 domain-containing protein n=1 Tax=Echinostoma caproni TaxID=27848 RepID=A0A183B1Q8_9TREM|nr:unnamed protein product [Echinostoma caproni]
MSYWFEGRNKYVILVNPISGLMMSLFLLYSAAKSGISRQNAAKLQAKEEEELAKAIALSLKESENKPSARAASSNATALSSSTVAQSSFSGTANRQTTYPSLTNETTTQASVSTAAVAKGRVRALYDFEAAEDNELTFKAGELIVLLDDSDENWWRGSNHRGEGLFPAQFVKREPEGGAPNAPQPLAAASAPEPSNVVGTSPNTAVQLDAGKLDECLRLINLVDPTGEFRPDPPELAQLEAECNAMAPLVDPELEKVDKRVLMLSDLNQRLLDAFQMYHDLMSRPTLSQVPPGAAPSTVGYYVPGQTAAAYLGAYATQIGGAVPYAVVGQDGMQPTSSYNPSMIGHPSSMHSYTTAADTMYASAPGPSSSSMHYGQVNAGVAVNGAGAATVPTSAAGPGAHPSGMTACSGLPPSHQYYPMMSDGSMDPKLNAQAMQSASGYPGPEQYNGE